MGCFVTFFPEKSNQKPRHAKNSPKHPIISLSFSFAFGLFRRCLLSFFFFRTEKGGIRSVEQFSVTCLIPNSK